jgi:hypothetical protein
LIYVSINKDININFLVFLISIGVLFRISSFTIFIIPFFLLLHLLVKKKINLKYFIKNKFYFFPILIFLPIFLSCIYNQTYDKKNIHLYIRTNDNTDNTIELLKLFIEKYGSEYGSIYYNDEDISENLKKYGEHEWNCERFKILGKIRQDSIDYAKKLNADYFVVDCDNFIIPITLEQMMKNRIEKKIKL